MVGLLGVFLAPLFLAIGWSQVRIPKPLPLGKIPPGKVFLLIQPHHDDHSWNYGHAGLIARLADAGYRGHFIRVSNDEKDGPHGYPHDDMVNLREAREAGENLGIDEVISLNWRNDYMDPTPLKEIRAQLILLIRRCRPDVVMAYHPWGHYDRNPDHRKVARAVGEAVWMAGYANVHLEHLDMGLRAHRVPYKYYTQRWDYGKGAEPNLVIELSESQVSRKARSYWLHRNVRLNPRAARAMQARLREKGLQLPELEGLSDIEAHARTQEWSMFHGARSMGEMNNVKYAEVFSYLGEWHHLPGLGEYINDNAVESAPSQ